MFRKIASAAILSIVFFPAVLFAQEPAVNGGNGTVSPAKESFSLSGKKISIEEAIKLVLKSNKDLLDARYDAKMADSDYQKFLSKYSVYLGAQGDMQYQNNPAAVESSQGTKIKTYDASVSAQKSFSTGTTVAAGFKESYTQTDYLENPQKQYVYDNTGARTDSYVNKYLGFKEYYSPSIFVSIQQELLKNSFGCADRKQEKMLQNATKLIQTAQESRIAGLVAGALVDIWDVTLKKTARDNATISMRETKKVRDIVAANARLGISESFDLNLYNALYAGAETKYTMAEKGYRDAIRKLYRTLDVDADEKAEVSEVLVLSSELKEVNVESALKSAFAKRADYVQALISEENSRLELGIARNGQLPSLTAGASITSYSMNEKMGEANSETTGFDSPIMGVNVKMTYPLFDTGSAVAVRDAGYKNEQAKIRLDKARREIKDDVVSKADQIRVMFTAYQKAKLAREESEKYFSSIQSYLRMGKVTSAVVKNALDSLTDSRQKELEALVSYNMTLVQMDLATNELLEKYNVNVKDYLSSAK